MRKDLSTVGDYHVKLGFDLFDYRIDCRCTGFWRRRWHGGQYCQNSICRLLGAIRDRLDNGPPRNSDLIVNLNDLSASATPSFEAGLLQYC